MTLGFVPASSPGIVPAFLAAKAFSQGVWTRIAISAGCTVMDLFTTERCRNRLRDSRTYRLAETIFDFDNRNERVEIQFIFMCLNLVYWLYTYDLMRTQINFSFPNTLSISEFLVGAVTYLYNYRQILTN